MLLIFIGIVGIGTGIFLYVYSEKQKKAQQQAIIEAHKEQKRQEEEKQKQANEIKQQMIDIIKKSFSENGWLDWNDEIHSEFEQFSRIHRALNPDAINLVWYNPNMGIAKIKGETDYYLTSGKCCSCPDFRERRKPCKHMYYLSICLPDYGEHLFLDTAHVFDRYDDNVFYGLKFSLIGRGQDEVKEYIVRRSGMFGNDMWKETSAVIMLGDKPTERYYTAVEKGVMVFTFDDLKELYNSAKHK